MDGSELAKVHPARDTRQSPATNNVFLHQDESQQLPQQQQQLFGQISRTSSFSSLVSDRPASDTSSLSNMTGYEDEFSMLKGLARGDHSISVPEATTANRELQERIGQLSSEVASLRGENVGLKIKMGELKSEEELEWSGRVRKLNGELSYAKDEVEMLKRANYELRKKLVKSEESKETERKILELNQSRGELEQEVTKNVNQIRYLTIQLESKEMANKLLKETITEQHAKIQEIDLKLKQCERYLDESRHNLESVKKSEEWYKTELHSCQNKKSILDERILELSKELQSEKSRNNRLQMDFVQLLRNCEDIQAKAMREKENMLRKLDNLRVNLLNSESKVEISSQEQPPAVCLQCEELKADSAALEAKFSRLEKSSVILETQNLKLISNEAKIQQQILEKDKQLLSLGQKLQTSDEEISNLRSQLKTLQIENSQIQQENEKLILRSQNLVDERLKIDQQVQKLRVDFEVIMRRFAELTADLSEKDRIIAALYNSNDTLKAKVADNKLFDDVMMENRMLKEDIMSNAHKIERFSCQIDELKCQNMQLNSEIDLLNAELRERNGLEARLEGQIRIMDDLKMELEASKGRTRDQFSKIDALNSKLDQVKKEKILQEKNVKIFERKNQNLVIHCSDLEREKEELLIKVENLVKEVESIRNEPKNTSNLKFNPLKNGFIRSTCDQQIQVNTESLEIHHLQLLLKVMKTEHREKIKRYEANIRTLLRKVKEHIRGRKTAEKALEKSSNYALENAELRSKLNTLRNRTSLIENNYNVLQTEVEKLEKERRIISLVLSETSVYRQNDLIASVEGLIKLASESQSTIERLEKDLKVAEDTISIRTGEISALKEELSNLEENLNQNLAKISTLEDQITEKSNILDSQKQQMSSYETQIKELSAKDLETRNLYAKSLEDYHSMITEMAEVKERYRELENRLKLHDLELISAFSQCLSLQESERALLDYKDQLLKEIETLKTDLIREHQDKLTEQKLVVELRMALEEMVKSVKENDNKKVTNRIPRSDFSKALAVLQQSSSTKTTLAPLEECVDSLKQEMEALNRMIRQNSQISSELSLLDELKAVAER